MTENEQIQEIIRVLCADYDNCEGCPFAVHFVDYSTCVPKEQAERIVTDKGYRKASEVAKEIIADMRKMINGYENIDVYLDRIEKKYTEEQNDERE